MRVFSSLTVSFSLPMSLHIQCNASAALPRLLFGWKVGFKDRFQHQRCRCHADPIPHARDAQRSEFAVDLRYIHASDWLWSISLLPEGKRQFSQPSLDPIRLDVRKILAVNARRAL